MEPTIPQRLPHKPIIITFEETITTKISTSLRIRHLKYIHKVEFLEKSPLLVKLRTLKRLHSLTTLDQTSFGKSDRSYRELSENKPKTIKIMKPLQKTVRYFSEDEEPDGTKNNPRSYLPALFPFVSKYSLEIDNIFSWIWLFHCPRIKNLQIQLHSPPDSPSPYYYYNSSSQLLVTENNVNKFMLRFEQKLTQYFLQKKCMEKLKIKIPSYFQEISNSLLRWLDKSKTYFPKLQSFHLDKVLGAEDGVSESDIKQIISQGYLRYATHLTLKECMSAQFCSSIGLEYLRNLLDLNVTLSHDTGVVNINQLIHLTSLEKLKLRIFNVSDEAEKLFLLKFVLPPNITQLVLRLQGFIWKAADNSKAGKKNLEDFFTSHPRFVQFAQQFSKVNLKSFTLRITDPCNRGCSKIMGLLAVALFRQISTLETVKYYHYIGPRRLGQSYPPESDNRFLSLGYFYQGLKPSRKSLKKLVIIVPKVIVSDLSNIKEKLPKLQTISIEDSFWASCLRGGGESILGVYNIFNMWNKSSSTSPLVVNIGGLPVFNEKNLKLYLNSLKTTPQGWDLTIKLHFSRKINKKILYEEVKAFLEQVNPKNNLSLTLNFDCHRELEEKEFQEIRTAMIKTSALKYLEVKDISSVVYISKRGVMVDEKE